MQLIGRLFHDLGIEPRVILVNIIGFLVLLGLLRRYFFGPMRQFLTDRRQRISAEWDNAEEARQQAETKWAELGQRSEEIMAEAREEAQQAKTEIQTEAQRIVNKAHQQARERERRAAEAISRQTQEAMAEARDELAALSAEVAEQLLRRSLDEESQRALLDAAIADIEQMAQTENQQE